MKTALIVDDFESIRFYHGKLLTGMGYRVLEAESAETALKMLAGHTVDFILLDLLLPGMNGWDFLRTLRANHGTTPVVIVTSDQREAEGCRTPEMGKVKIIHKPILPGKLEAEIKSWLV